MTELTEVEFAFLGEIERYDAFLQLYHSPSEQDGAALDALTKSSDPLIPLILLRYFEEIPEKRACLAIIRLIEDGNPVVAEAAMRCYSASHYPKKPHLLKPLIFSDNFRACRFAIRTLARAGFMDVLPLILREIPDRQGPILRVMLDALRYIPHRRSVPILLPLAESTEEPLRYLVVDVLSDLQFRTRALPPAFFIRKLKDESARVRGAALEALQRFPSKRVEGLILDAALSQTDPENARVRAVRALQNFPSSRTAAAVTRLSAVSTSASVRISCEIVLRTFPRPVIRQGVLPLLEAQEVPIRRQAAIYLAEFLGADPKIREAILSLWRKTDEGSSLEFVDALRALGGAETVVELRASLDRSPLTGYAAACALSQMRGEVPGRALLELIRDSKMTPTVRQALLDRWAKRGPDDSVRAETLEAMHELLREPVMNLRYLAVQILDWYPLEKTMNGLLDLIARESDREVLRVAVKQILRGLGRDPLKFVESVRAHPACEALRPHLVKVISGRAWDSSRIPALLDAVCSEPIALRREPKRFSVVCLRMLEFSTVTIQDLWPWVSAENTLKPFLTLLLQAVANPRRRTDPLPLAFLELQAMMLGPALRGLIYELLAVENRPEGGEYLAAALLRESDEHLRTEGSALLRKLWETAQ
ncbi:MAG: hypothetical protein AUJ52_10985 [Elusimicrobia bacterium CG1_02_63_36]|nr:MAG: hypothetical protein AUJ52_10985 [Elusimicrobia bacterium CG1_02_63_36]PIP85159.1 MAG: hypothetical protein COR54_00425 [Elusimicrobia bacterium CG22_combo_CG10-13_8_21_14_all_63_91]PJA15786.1 MAG: hypothetical protein COX66_09165 [Elusimicrobia bacterium CG_4_10_14_0_2_um_filter_63_34]PJB24878.1 MAG: hypothetical protein CO113_11655 [Elusimicrobia bacterium CG_4_9_14_3_um_filter_62_55]